MTNIIISEGYRKTTLDSGAIIKELYSENDEYIPPKNKPTPIEEILFETQYQTLLLEMGGI